MKTKKEWAEVVRTVLSRDVLGETDIGLDDSWFYFGSHGVDWEVKDVAKFLYKLESLGAKNIEVEDGDTIRFDLPGITKRTDLKKRAEILLYVLTTSPHPADVKHDKKKNRLTCSWDW